MQTGCMSSKCSINGCTTLRFVCLTDSGTDQLCNVACSAHYAAVRAVVEHACRLETCAARTLVGSRPYRVASIPTVCQVGKVHIG